MNNYMRPTALGLRKTKIMYSSAALHNKPKHVVEKPLL